MNTLVLDIDKTHSQSEIVELFSKNKLSKGDKLRLEGETELPPMAVMGTLVLLFVCLAIYFNKQKKQNENAEKLLNDIFKNYKSVEGLEKQIEKEYDINIVVENSLDEVFGIWKGRNISLDKIREEQWVRKSK